MKEFPCSVDKPQLPSPVSKEMTQGGRGISHLLQWTFGHSGQHITISCFNPFISPVPWKPGSPCQPLIPSPPATHTF